MNSGTNLPKILGLRTRPNLGGRAQAHSPRHRTSELKAVHPKVSLAGTEDKLAQIDAAAPGVPPPEAVTCFRSARTTDGGSVLLGVAHDGVVDDLCFPCSHEATVFDGVVDGSLAARPDLR